MGLLRKATTSDVKEYVSEMAAEKVEHDLRRSKTNIAQELLAEFYNGGNSKVLKEPEETDPSFSSM